MKNLRNLFVILSICFFGVHFLRAQQIDFTLHYNGVNNRYEVYGKATATMTGLNVGGGSQLSVVVPAEVPDNALTIQSVMGGNWGDNSQVFAPSAAANHDFHSITSDGSGVADFFVDEPTLLFTFQLSGGNCLEGIRLFENTIDPNEDGAGMSGTDFRNFFADAYTLINYYQSNYNNGGSACILPPNTIPDTTVTVEEENTLLVDIAEVLPNENLDSLITTIIRAPNHGTATLSTSGTITYSPFDNFVGMDSLQYEVCNTAMVCDTATVWIQVMGAACSLNCDTDGDGDCDLNCDTDGDGICDINCDTDGDGNCDLYCDFNGDGIADALPTIIDPCNCLANASSSTASDGQFSETVSVKSKPGENWTITDIRGLYQNPTVPNFPPSSGNGSPYVQLPYSVGTALTEITISNFESQYVLQGIHVDAVGYQVTVTNGEQDLTIGNTCNYSVSCGFTLNTDPDGTPGQPVPDDEVGMFIMPTGTAAFVDTLSTCAPDKNTFVDDGLVDGLYKDSTARNNLITLCPQNKWQTLTVTFSEFSLAPGDNLIAYDGTDATGTPIATMTGIGVSQANGGWISASCDVSENPHGCLTFRFTTNGDNVKGTGWKASVSCDDRNVNLVAPSNLSAALTCSETYEVFEIKPATVTADCGAIQDSQLVRITNAQGVVCIDTTLGAGDVIKDTFGIGIYLVTYKLKNDTTKSVNAFINVQGAGLVCNDKINVPLGAGCNLQLSPDDLLEGTCDTIIDTAYYYITLEYVDESGRIQAVSGGGKGGRYPTISKEMFGECGSTITARIEKHYYEGLNLSFCNNGVQKESCTVIVEAFDQTAPIFQNLETTDTFQLCSAELNPDNLGIPTPTAIDDCSTAKVTFAGIDIISNGDNCDTTRANIKWTAADGCGNAVTQTQLVVIVRPELKDIIKIPDVVLSCGEDSEADLTNFAKTGMPQIKVGKIEAGILQPSDTIPLDTTFTCGYVLQHRDVQFPSDCGLKVFRYWSVIDWCAPNGGVLPLDTQLIILKDTLAPKFSATQLDTARLEFAWNVCATDLSQLAKPLATDNCGVPTVVMAAVHRIEAGEKRTVPTSEWAQISYDSLEITWVAEDKCPDQLKKDTLYQFVLIKDTQPPVAICTDKINLSLASNGTKLHYRDIDKGSYDACGLIRYELSRDEENWDSTVAISCEDVHQVVTVYLRVTDRSGNQTTCWMTVNVEDKIAPICGDLPDRTGTCGGAHISKLGQITDINKNGKMDDTEWVDMTEEQAALFNQEYGTPICSDNISCQPIVLQQQYQLIQKGCGIIDISRRFRAVDGQGKGQVSNWETQNINIESQADWSITLPADWEGSCGDSVPSSELAIQNGACDLITYDVEDKVFTVQDGACLKVVRTFTIINWCTYQAGTPAVQISRVEDIHGSVNDLKTLTAEDFAKVGRLEYTQILKLTDEEAPVIEVLPVDECLEGADCADTKQFAIFATDCHDLAPTLLDYKWTLSTEGDFLANGVGASFDYPIAAQVKYQVVWTVSDNCGNSTKETVTYEFKDCKKPSPYCLHGTAIDLMETVGTIQVWATDMERGSSDNCTTTDKLRYRIWHQSLDSLPTTTEGVLALPQVLTFNCTHLGNQEVYLYAIDEAGNWDFCTTYINVQDNTNACDEVVIPNEEMALITGTIMDWRQQTVEEVMVVASASESTQEMMTKEDGHYHFNLAMYEDYSVQPRKNDYPLNGVSTFDLVLIAKHILAREVFTNPYQLIAADVNRSGTVTAFDMVQIRRLILAIETEFTNNTSWRFVDANYSFPTENPIGEVFPEAVNIVDLVENRQQNFVAVKIGDVNGNARPNNLLSVEERTTPTVFEIQCTDLDLVAGQTYDVTFSTEQLASIQGYQFTLAFEDLHLNKIEPSLSQKENFGLTNVAQGLLTTSWNQALSTDYRESVSGSQQLFQLQITAQRNGKLSELLQLTDRPTAIEAYDEADNLMEVQITFIPPANQDAFELFQNQPNPFSDKTNIGFYLPEASEVELTLRDEVGRVLQTIKLNPSAGYNTIPLSKKDLPQGLIIYQLSTKFGAKVKKMLHLD